MNRTTAEPKVDAMPGKRASKWVEYQKRFAAKTTPSYDFVWDFTADAVGPFCTDIDGNVLLDFTSHIGSAPLGYNHPKLQETLAEFDVPTPTKIAGQNFYSGSGADPDSPTIPGPSQLMERLTDLTSGYGLDTVFLSNSGAEAVENAIKICYDHRGGPNQGITFRGAFHGRTLGALSLNRSKAAHRRDYPQIAGIVDLPFCTETDCTQTTCECGFFSAEAGESMLAEMLHPKRGYLDPSDLAYVIVEPIQGEGGYRFPSDTFAKQIQQVCTDHDILLIADEIQTGLGRTGTWWGSDHYALDPDVIVSAKALQVGATVANRETFPDENGRISSTWGGGDILASMQGALTIDVIEDEGLLENAQDRGEQMKARLEEAKPPGVSNIRGKGLMVAFDLPSGDVVTETIRVALTKGLLTLKCGHRSMRLIPPLDTTEREINLGVDLLLEAITETA